MMNNIDVLIKIMCAYYQLRWYSNSLQFSILSIGSFIELFLLFWELHNIIFF